MRKRDNNTKNDYICSSNHKKLKSVKIFEVVNALEKFAPLPLQEDYDNAGLQVGLTETEVSGALLCLDVTEEILEEAIQRGCNLVVSHHPLIFRPLRCVSDRNMVQRCVTKAILHGITIVSMHTNMDNAPGGVNGKIAEKMGLRHVSLLAPKQVGEVTGGSGVIGELASPMPSMDFISMVKERFGVECVQTNQILQKKIAKVAICGGAGAFLLGDAIAAGADAFVTGEMHYHEFFGCEQVIQICVIGQYQSEQFTSELFQSIIEERCPGVRCCLAKTHTNPIIYL